MSQIAGRCWIPKDFFLSLRQITWRSNPEKSTLSCLGVPWLFKCTIIQPPTGSWASPLPPLTSDSGVELVTMSSTDWQQSHQTTVVVIFSVQMCLYIPLNMWKCHRNRNLKFQKIDPARNRTQVIRVISGDHTTRPLSHIQEHQIWKYKLDLTSSCQSPG